MANKLSGKRLEGLVRHADWEMPTTRGWQAHHCKSSEQLWTQMGVHTNGCCLSSADHDVGTLISKSQGVLIQKGGCMALQSLIQQVAQDICKSSFVGSSVTDEDLRQAFLRCGSIWHAPTAGTRSSVGQPERLHNQDLLRSNGIPCKGIMSGHHVRPFTLQQSL